MHISTPLNKDRVRNHLTYSSWKYLLLVVCAIFGWSLIYTVTAPRVPEDKRIDLYVLSYSADQEKINAFILPIAQEVTPEMESVSSVGMVPDSTYGAMQLTAYFAAGDGDIYFLDENYFKSFASNGVFLPLEDLVADGTIAVSDVELSKGYVTYIESYDSEMRPVVGDQHLYGIPLDSFYGYMDGMGVDNRGLYAVIAANNKNDANVIPFFNALLQAGRGDMPQWLIDSMAQQENQ